MPEAHLEWQPHPKSMSLGQLARHVATLPTSRARSKRPRTWRPAARRNSQAARRGSPARAGLLFKRVLRKGAFPKAKTNKAMNPVSGPATPAEGRIRLETAHQKFDEACRQIASHGERLRTTVFGAVPVEEYVRFMELHTRHHGRQLADTQ